MAHVNGNYLVSECKNYLNKINSQQWENIDLTSTQETIRILLFKECRLSHRQLIFDSYLSQIDDKNSKDTFKKNKKNMEEFSYLTEMIFGSTAMKYNDTYYKMHDVFYPHRIIFTQVFSIPNMRKFQLNLDSSFNLNFQTSSNIMDNLSGNSLSQYSMESRLDSFSIFRKNNWAPTNSTTTTIDSGFSDSSFSTTSSFQPSYESFTRENLQPSNTSLKIFGSFSIDSDSSKINLNYSRLGLALIVPKSNDDENIYIEHISFIESILWRIRQYIELAFNSPKHFLSTLFEISFISAKWLTKELNFCIKKHDDDPGGITKTFIKLKQNLFYKQKLKDINFQRFCTILNELEIKETKFFLGALLTAVLTHHTGWVASCYSLKQINLTNSYNAIKLQLANLYGATGNFTKTSRTIIYGYKPDTMKKIIFFLNYFIRYFRVQKRLLERINILEENKIIDDICAKKRTNFYSLNENKNNKSKMGLTKTKTTGQNLNLLNQFDDDNYDNNEEFSERTVLFILGDNDKLQNLKTTKEITNTEETIRTEENKKTVKLKVIKFPLPKVKFLDDSSEIKPYEFLSKNGFPDMYVPDKIFQATNIPELKLKNTLKNDLLLKKSCLFPNEIEENVTILGNTDNWEVNVWSSSRKGIIRNRSDAAVNSCPIISNMLEIVMEMSKINVSKEQCASIMEQKLVEICLKGHTLSQFLLNTEFCSMETLLSTLKLNIDDVPLLMSVGSNINPEILQKYGISY